jgi:flagellar hook-associated protein 2
VSVSQDTDTLVKNVQAFVDDYNKMFDALTDKYYEKQYSDYGVLTKTQENGMTADQITKWNEKAKSGLLYHDQSLSKIISAMREAIATPVDSSTSSYNSMMSIGITSSTDQGHLTLDTDKLKKALAADPDCVRNIFAASGDVTTTKNGVTKTTTDYDSEGVLNRISDSLYTNLKTLKSYAGNSTETSDGSTLGTLIETLKTKMSDFQVQMDAYEEQLYDKYDAMETAIQQLSVQLGYVSGSSS